MLFGRSARLLAPGNPTDRTSSLGANDEGIAQEIA